MELGAPIQEEDVLDGIVSSALSDVGSRREENQDAYAFIFGENFKLFVVADGMGGAHGGGIASKLAIKTIEESLAELKDLTCEALTTAVKAANTAINLKGNEDPALQGMGTTTSALGFCKDGRIIVLNVGDSRGYFVNNESIKLLTEDHTLVKELVRTGAISIADAENHPVSHMLTRSLGPLPEVQIDCQILTRRLTPGDKFLLCSDGLHSLVTDKEIFKVVSTNNADMAVRLLVHLANERGGSDNITVIVLEFQPDSTHSNFGPSRTEEEDILENNEDDQRAAHATPSHSPRTSPKSENVRPRRHNIARGSARRDQSRATVAAAIAPRSWRWPLAAAALAGSILMVILGGVLASLFRPSMPGVISEHDPYAGDLMDLATRPAVTGNEIEQVDHPKISIDSSLAMVEPQVEGGLNEVTESLNDKERIKRARDLFSQSIAKLQNQLSAFDDQPPENINATLKEARTTAEDLQTNLADIEQSIDTASRKLSQWYGRQKRLETQDPLKLASEVGAASEMVQASKVNFEKITYDFIKKRDELDLYPSNEKLKDEVAQLKNQRAQALKLLQDQVRETVRSVLAETDTRIDELKFQRDLLNIQLQSVKQDLEFAKSITSNDPALKQTMRQKLQQKLDGLKASVAELDSMLQSGSSE